jgi:DNA repair protein RecO (recombination protein O)
MDWDAPAIVLDARPFGEGDAVATVMTEAHGLHRGLARGGTSRAQAGLWQPGNLAQVRWVGRLSDQLGSFSAEMIHAGAAAVLDDPLGLAMLTAVCAVAEGALPERESHPRAFHGLVHLVARLPLGAAMLNDLVRWETALLADLGYGLDLTSCALTGATADLAFVSPRTGRAVTEAAAGIWTSRLLRLPGFLAGGNAAAPAATTPADWRDGLALTGHFLARDAFGAQHRPLPRARQMLYDRVAAMANESRTTELATTELGTTESSTTESSTAAELRTTELGTTELGTTELGTTALNTTELNTTELNTTELNTTGTSNAG